MTNFQPMTCIINKLIKQCQTYQPIALGPINKIANHYQWQWTYQLLMTIKLNLPTKNIIIKIINQWQ